MPLLDKTYSISLDLKKRTVNKIPSYYISDNETSDMMITLTNDGVPVNLENSIVLMVSVSPDKQRYYDFIDVKTAMDGVIYCNLKQHCKNADGIWIARLMIISNEEKLVTDTFTYKISTDEFVNADTDVQPEDRFPILTEMISRLSTIELNESSRQTAELSRVEAEKQRELIKQQFITDVNKLIADTNASVQTTLTQNTQKIDTLVSDTTVKIDNYKTEKDLDISNDLAQYKNTTTQDIEAYKTTKNAEIDAYKLQKDADIDIYVTGKNEELNLYVAGKNAELDTYVQNKDIELDTYVRDKNSTLDAAESIRVNSENVRVSSENTRVSNENDRKTAETGRVSAETTRVNSENTRISNENARKTAETSRVTAENTRDTNETARVSAENTRKSNETARVSAEYARVTAETTRAQQHADRESFMNGYAGRLTAVETTNTTQNERLTTVESSSTSHGSRLDKVEATTTNHGARLDKVEYQNKVQDTYISGLFNENNDKRLTIEGGGNDLKLEGSAEGLAQVNKIVGNTAVNYCTGGDRELYLNGDIDVTGTSVSTTEGVDNGLVDVVCEGDTLVNLCTDGSRKLSLNGNIDASGVSVTTTEGVEGGIVDVVCEGNTLVNLARTKPSYLVNATGEYYAPVGLNLPLKANTVYTRFYHVKQLIKGDVISNPTMYDMVGGDTNKQYSTTITNTGWHISSFTNLYEGTSYSIIVDAQWRKQNTNDFTLEIDKFMLIEGDYTNKPIPPYFEGMKSVGQDDTNGHKVEIVSQNKNLFDVDAIIESKFLFGQISNSRYGELEDSTYTNTTTYMPVKNGKTYIFSYEYDVLSISSLRAYCYYDVNKKLILSTSDTVYDPINRTVTFNSTVDGYIRISYDKNCTNIQFEMSSVKTTYTPHASNTKLIPLSEPLRGLPNGAKDRFVKRDGKWYIERNYGKVVLNGSESDWEGKYSGTIVDSMNTSGFYTRLAFINRNKGRDELNYAINDKFIIQPHSCQYDPSVLLDREFLSTTADGRIAIRINKSKLISNDITGFKQWLQANPVTVIYELAEPTYEPLTVTPELQTYLETTHISNNSLIPCNMNIKNTGYLTKLIKPSTLYTVVTDRTGSEAMTVNFNGVSASTTTNTVSLTTPATLTSDILRISGKGISCSNVRLLEGNFASKTLPPYFEGMKSVGQDDTNGHKIELVSQNKNLVKRVDAGLNCIIGSDNQTVELTFDLASKDTYFYIQTYNKLVSGKSYTISFDVSGMVEGDIISLGILSQVKNTFYLQNGRCSKTFINDEVNSTDIVLIDDLIRTTSNRITITNIQLEENTVSTTYTPRAQNTLTIPLSEPLRGLPNGVKDRFVKKEGKWYVERNCGNVVLNDLTKAITHNTGVSNQNNTIVFSIDANDNNLNYKPSTLMCTCDRFNNGNAINNDVEFIYLGQNPNIRILKSKLATQDSTGFKQWLQANPTTVIYELATPTYEPLNVTPELQTYLETTHISNNSIIPCNMNVKNTGFNSIIKPSTLYTVISDNTGKGTFGVNLGGTKLTTATNKLTITTPATLTENMLRPYGKGLKGSKFRVLEGDNMSLTYPYFEGLKSTFEGQLVTQEMVTAGTDKAENLGKYKCNVKVRGKNLFDGRLEIGGWDSVTGKKWQTTSRNRNVNPINVKPNTTYVVNTILTNFAVLMYDGNNNYEKVSTNKSFTTTNKTMFINIHMTENENIQIEEGTVATPYEPYYERTQAVYLTSPLLKGDEIVVKDDGLYHYHKKGKYVFKGTEPFDVYLSSTHVKYAVFDNNTNFIKGNYNNNILCDRFPNIGSVFNATTDEGIGTHTAYVIRFNFLISRFNIPNDTTEFKTWLSQNPTTVIYELAEPYYEKIADYPITLDIIPTSTLSVDSLIPCQTISSTYTGSVPSVYKIEETSVQNSADIVDTQIAVDFLLMNSPSVMMMTIDNNNSGLTEKGVNNMGAYFAGRIMKGYLKYSEVVARYPQFKDDIDFILRSEGREDLITQ